MSSRVEVLLGRTLGIGVAVSTVLLAIGLVMTLTVGGPVAGGLLNAGLLVLMGTPMTRVLISCVEYIRERDWFFAISGIAVLLVLAVTVWQATR
ncbi:MAG TPA: DUF1634 domain-containing protein [Luteitalea sp.]|nr:DUF1634 domain-containing protein [Luteitalea sp.]